MGNAAGGVIGEGEAGNKGFRDRYKGGKWQELFFVSLNMHSYLALSPIFPPPPARSQYSVLAVLNEKCNTCQVPLHNGQRPSIKAQVASLNNHIGHQPLLIDCNRALENVKLILLIIAT